MPYGCCEPPSTGESSGHAELRAAIEVAIGPLMPRAPREQSGSDSRPARSRRMAAVRGTVSHGAAQASTETTGDPPTSVGACASADVWVATRHEQRRNPAPGRCHPRHEGLLGRSFAACAAGRHTPGDRGRGAAPGDLAVGGAPGALAVGAAPGQSWSRGPAPMTRVAARAAEEFSCPSADPARPPRATPGGPVPAAGVP